MPSPVLPFGGGVAILLERAEVLEEELHPLRVGSSPVAEPEQRSVPDLEYLFAVGPVQSAHSNIYGYFRSP
jgi:hypothetical protein